MNVTTVVTKKECQCLNSVPVFARMYEYIGANIKECSIRGRVGERENVNLNV